MNEIRHYNNLITRRVGWEIVYTGFILILLCFFIMLCTFSTMEEGKVTRFVQSFVNTLCILQGGVKLDRSKVVIPPSADMVGIESDLGKVLQDLKLDIEMAYETLKEAK